MSSRAGRILRNPFGEALGRNMGLGSVRAAFKVRPHPKTMNNQGTKPIAAHTITDATDQSEESAMNISIDQLRDIADLLDIIDGFLRSDTIADHLTDYLHATGADHAPQPHGPSYTTGPLIDQISFTAHHLRAHQRKPLQ